MVAYGIPSKTPARIPYLWPPIAIFLVALFVRLIYLWQIHDSPFFTVLMGDARSYDEWARRIAHGEWIGRGVFYQAPLYPYFLAVLYSIGGHSLVFVRICQAIIGSASCVLLALTVRHLFSYRAGTIAGFVLALYAPAIFFGGLLQKAVLDVFFICLLLWIMARIGVREKSDAGAFLWLGLTMGALSLTRENALVFVAVIIAWILLSVRERLLAAGAFALGLAIVLLPVAIRNELVGGEFHLTTSQFGPNFFMGNNARTDGTAASLRSGRGSPEYERQDATELAEYATGRHLTPSEVSGYWTGQALAFIKSQPYKWTKLMARKAALVWNRTEWLDTEAQESYAEWSSILRFGAWIGNFGVLVPLAAFGAIVTWSERRRLWVLYTMILAYAASVTLFYIYARYRLPLVPFLIVFAAAGLATLAPMDGTLSRPRVAPVSILAVLAIAVFANWPMLPTDLMRSITEVNLSAALLDEHRYDEAIDHCRRAEAIRPDYVPAYNNMGVALVATGRTDEAVAAYERAIALQPTSSDPEYNLANILLREGKAADATTHFQRALQLAPGSPDAYNNLGIALAEQGKYQDALHQFDEALRLDPQGPRTHRNIGDALASLGRRDEAVAHLRRASELDPSDGQAHYDLASLLLENQEFEGAEREFRVALALMPESCEAHNNLGIALASLGRIDEALGEFRQALRIQPDFADAQRNLTMALQVQRQRPPRQKRP